MEIQRAALTTVGDLGGGGEAGVEFTGLAATVVGCGPVPGSGHGWRGSFVLPRRHSTVLQGKLRLKGRLQTLPAGLGVLGRQVLRRGVLPESES